MEILDSHLWDGFIGAFLGTVGAFAASLLLIRHESAKDAALRRRDILGREIEQIQLAMRQVNDSQTALLKILDDRPDELHFGWRTQIEVVKVHLLLPQLELISEEIFESAVTAADDVLDFLRPDVFSLDQMVEAAVAYMNSLGPIRTSLGGLLNQKEHDLRNLR